MEEIKGYFPMNIYDFINFRFRKRLMLYPTYEVYKFSKTIFTGFNI